MLDGGEADDKIIAVLSNDSVWDAVSDIDGLPEQMVARLRHYFLTYKTLPGEPATVKVGSPYNRAQALKVIQAACEDYEAEFGEEESS